MYAEIDAVLRKPKILKISELKTLCKKGDEEN